MLLSSLPCRTDINVFEAGANGAYIAGRTAAITIINYISFIALLSFIDSALGYMGSLVGWEELGLAVSLFFYRDQPFYLPLISVTYHTLYTKQPDLSITTFFALFAQSE